MNKGVNIKLCSLIINRSMIKSEKPDEAEVEKYVVAPPRDSLAQQLR